MSQNQQIIPGKRKKKFTGGNASKRHRDRVNVEFHNLAKLLPFPENVIAKLDKSSILRLAVSYIRAKSFFRDTLMSGNVFGTNNAKTVKPLENGMKKQQELLEECSLAELFLQALDGFLIVITEDMKVLYISDSVRDYLGYCQAGIIHESLLQFVHWADHEALSKAVRFTAERKPSSRNMANRNHMKGQNGIIKQEPRFHEKEDSTGVHSDSEEDTSSLPSINSSASLSSSASLFSSDGDNTIENRRFQCRMKCAFSCSSRFYTAFRAFQFSGHLRKSTIQEGKERKVVNTLIAFCSPSLTSKFDPADLVAETTFDDRGSGSEDYEDSGMKMIGLHIEPRLRPHVAPIPIAASETERRTTASHSSSSSSYDSNRKYNGQQYHRNSEQPQFNGYLSQHLRQLNGYPRLMPEYIYPSMWRIPSSLPESPRSDSSSPRGLKRDSSNVGSSGPHYNDADVINRKRLRLEEEIESGLRGTKHRNGISHSPYDDIHSGAQILMQLQANKRRIEVCRRGNDVRTSRSCDSDTSFDGKRDTELSLMNQDFQRDSILPPGSLPTMTSLRSERSERYIEPKRRLSRDGHIDARLSPSNGISGPRLIPSSGHDGTKFIPRNRQTETRFIPPYKQSEHNSVSPTLSRSSSTSPSNKEAGENKGFHISTILGLNDGRQHLEESRQEPRSEDEDGHRCENCKHNGCKTNTSATDKKSSASGADNSSSNIDDIKTSFAQILQGLTTTIRQNLDKTIDTVFKPANENVKMTSSIQ